MTARTASRLAWSLFALVLVNAAVASVLDLRTTGELGALPFIPVFVSFGVVGALITSRRPDSVLGWLFLFMGVGGSLGELASEYAHYGLAHTPPLRGAIWSAWVETISIEIPFMPLCLTFLLFPHGRLPSGRWRTVAWFTVATGVVGIAATALADVNFHTSFPRVTDPVQLLPASVVRPVYAAYQFAILALFLVAATALVVRYRRSRGEERLQVKWVAFAAALTAVGFTVLAIVPLGLEPVAAFILFVPLIPIAAGVAVLKYRLYDIDLVIRKTVVYGLLAGFVTAVYFAIVVGIGAAIGARGNLGLSILATAVVAVGFQPIRERSRRLANRLVYGKRATPYEVLSEFSQGMAGTYSADDVLLRMVRVVVEATGAVQATVWLRLGETLQPEASWPPAAAPPDPIPLDGHGVEEALLVAGPRSQPFLVQHQDDLLGALTVQLSPSEPLTKEGEKLIADLTAQTGLGIRFERMKERALFARALASFLPPDVADMVEASPSALSLREEVEATILFSDIRGFSSLAERLSPREVADVVGRHLAAMAEVVSAHGGTLDKFAGDAVMAVFGAPRPADDHAQRALRCAVAMQRRQAALNAEAEGRGLPRFEIGIGVNTGTVIAGTLGGAGRLDYTVIGDAVNVAQRLQSEAHGGEILTSAETVRLAEADGAEPVGMKQLKGRRELVDAYRIPWQEAARGEHPGETARAE